MTTYTATDTDETHWRRWTMDMQLVATDPDSLPTARREVDAELNAVEAATSRFRPDSEINALANASGRPTPISELLAEMLAAALLAARQTDGDVDPTVGSALIALGYDRDIVADSSTVARTGPTPLPALWSTIKLDERLATVPRGIVLDLGATAKAVAADRCARRVHAVTGAGILVNLGGDIATAGTAPDGGWQVLVQDGDGIEGDEPAASVALPSGAALATSSTVRRRWRLDSQVVHHIIDPRTGQSAEPVWRTVSVAAATCCAANTVSTAAIVRGWRAMDWIRGQSLPARLVDLHGAVHTLGGWPADDTGGRR